MDKAEIAQTKNDLHYIIKFPEVLAVLLFGSQVTGNTTSRSDIDVCVVAPDLKTSEEKSLLLSKIWRGLRTSRYDIWLFEELPLCLRISIITHHSILFCKDKPALFEHFYFYRKIWKDQAHRQTIDL